MPRVCSICSPELVQLSDTLLESKVEQRNERVKTSPRCQPEAGLRNLQFWVARHKLTGQVELRLEGRTVVLGRNQAAIDRAMELGGCWKCGRCLCARRAEREGMCSAACGVWHYRRRPARHRGRRRHGRPRRQPAPRQNVARSTPPRLVGQANSNREHTSRSAPQVKRKIRLGKREYERRRRAALRRAPAGTRNRAGHKGSQHGFPLWSPGSRGV
jgi:hypothetical protein